MLRCSQGKDAEISSAHEKEIKIECKLTDKNLEKMVEDGHIDVDLGVTVPALVDVKTEEGGEDIKLLKDALADLKWT